MSLIARAGLRELARHPVQTALAVAGVAVGVAVVVAVDLADESARRAFRISTEATAGRATHQIQGGSAGIDERLLAAVRIEMGLEAAAPVVEEYATLPDQPGRVVRLLGVDPLLEAPFRPSLAPAARASGELGRFLTEPGAALLAGETAAELGVAPGDALPLRLGVREMQVRVVGLLEPRDRASREVLASLLLVDVATAQELAASPGRLSRIELVLPEGTPGEAALERLRSRLPAGVTVTRTAARSESLDQMTRAFRFNLRALALLALACGGFLIFNTATFSVVRRRPLFGRLRALGVRRREVLAMVLAESLAVGLAGSLAGLALGVLLGRGLVGLVLQTIQDLYFAFAVRSFDLAPDSLLRGLALGVGVSLAAALPPALEAASAPPRATLSRAALEAGSRRGARLAAGLGGALLAGGGALLLAPSPSLPLAFGGLFALLFGYALQLPLALALGLGRAARLPALPVTARMAARSLAASLSRSGVAVSALALAVAVSVGIGLMIGSLRGAVVDWLRQTLVGDLYVAPPTRLATAANLALEPGFVARARALPGIERVHALRTLVVEPAGSLPVRVLGIDVDEASRAAFRFRAGDPEDAWRAVAAGEAVLLSEPFASRRALAPGDRLGLPTARGVRELPVAGVYADYSSDQGVALMAAPLFVELFEQETIAAIALFAAPGTDLDRLARAVERAAAPGEVLVQSNRALLEESLAIFDRTFRITGVLRLLSLAVALLGILAALAAIELERGRELATLRALGASRAQVRRLVIAEGAWMGAAAGLFALPLGALLAAAMVYVVNRRSFGWSMELALAAGPFFEALALAVGAALAAAALPAMRIAAADVVPQLEEE